MKTVAQKFASLVVGGLSLMSLTAMAGDEPITIPGAPLSGVSGCYTITRAATYDLEWTYNLSLSTDTRILRQYYPAQCAGNFLCDIVSYRIQHFDGSWSQEYYPGVNDVGVFNTVQRRMWFSFYDHNHAFTFCN